MKITVLNFLKTSIHILTKAKRRKREEKVKKIKRKKLKENICER